MAGLPPLIGFVGKESAFSSLLDVAQAGARPGISPLAGWLMVVGVVLGSVLTVAYTARFLWGTFTDKPDGRRPSSPRHRVDSSWPRSCWLSSRLPSGSRVRR